LRKGQRAQGVAHSLFGGTGAGICCIRRKFERKLENKPTDCKGWYVPFGVFLFSNEKFWSAGVFLKIKN